MEIKTKSGRPRIGRGLRKILSCSVDPITLEYINKHISDKYKRSGYVVDQMVVELKQNKIKL
jgi:hypothetical protein